MLSKGRVGQEEKQVVGRQSARLGQFPIYDAEAAAVEQQEVGMAHVAVLEDQRQARVVQWRDQIPRALEQPRLLPRQWKRMGEGLAWPLHQHRLKQDWAVAVLLKGDHAGNRGETTRASGLDDAQVGDLPLKARAGIGQ